MTAKQKFIKMSLHVVSVIGLIATIILCIYGYRLGLFTSTAALADFIARVGMWGGLAFVVLQIIQVVIPIIPGGLTCLAGVLIFGPIYGFLYNYIGISIGSVIIFLLARRYGKPFIQSVASEKTYDRYIGWLNKGKRFDGLFALAIFFPVAPDDFLCMLAGITKIKTEKFIAIIILCKPVSIALYSFGLSKIAALIGSIHL